MANLYWKSGGDQSWDIVGNWWKNANATIQADNVPWVAGDTTYLDYNLTNATTLTGAPTMNSGGDYGAGATGSCSIDGVVNVLGAVVGGTFTGGFVNATANESHISGGTFTGAVSNSGNINGGTFTGAFSNSWIVAGGTFSSGAITITQNGGNTLLAIAGGPTYSYPTPASGGGGANISTLLNLPWFVKM
jgi:hypothetical protein